MQISKCYSDYDLTRFNWHLLDWCNYQCSYCFVKTLTKDFKDTSRIVNEWKLIVTRLKTFPKEFEVCITGGEPTLHPEFFEIIEELTKVDNLQMVWLFTNLSRSIDFLKKINYERVTLYGSWHPEFSSDDFIDKAKELNCEVHISITNNKNHWDKTEDIINQCIDNNIIHRLNVVEKHDDELNDRFKKYLHTAVDTIPITVEYDNGTIEKHTEHTLSLNELNYFKGYNCEARSYGIRLDGTIFNTCTDEVMPLVLKDIIKTIKCPKKECIEGLLMYPKEVSDE